LENMNEFVKMIAPVTACFSALYVVLRLVAFFTPENRKNLKSNVSEIKAIATSKKKHLFIALIIFAVAIGGLVFSFLSKSAPVNQPMEGVVKFGGPGGEIEWIVIEKNEQEHYATLMSKNCLDAQPYQKTLDKGKNLKWENSSLKNWLNSEFIKKFSESDRADMVDFDDGKLVTLLDDKQAAGLAENHKDWLICAPAENVGTKAKGWWLKVPADGSDKERCAKFVNSFGKIKKKCTTFSINNAEKSLFVRPVIRKKM